VVAISQSLTSCVERSSRARVDRVGAVRRFDLVNHHDGLSGTSRGYGLGFSNSERGTHAHCFPLLRVISRGDRWFIELRRIWRIGIERFCGDSTTATVHKRPRRRHRTMSHSCTCTSSSLDATHSTTNNPLTDSPPLMKSKTER